MTAKHDWCKPGRATASVAAIKLAIRSVVLPAAIMLATGVQAHADEDACIAAPTASCLTDLALASVGRNDSDRFSFALLSIAGAQAKAGQIDAALATARGIAESNMRNAAMREIAVTQAKARSFNAALTTAQGIDHAFLRAVAFADVAMVQEEAGQLGAYKSTIELALAATRSIEDGSRSSVLLMIATAQAKAGDFEAALATARGIDNAGGGRAVALAAIAEAQIKAGETGAGMSTFDAALAAARSQTDYRGFTIQQVATAQAKAGKFDAALANARTIDEDNSRANAFSAIAAAQAEAGEFAAALSTIEAALAVARRVDKDSRDLSLWFVAKAQVQARELDAASGTVRGILNAGYRAMAFSEIAAAQWEFGQTVAARSTIDAALAAARAEEFDGARLGALSDIALTQFKAGEIDAGLTTARGIDDGNGRGVAYAKIAAFLATDEQALITARPDETAAPTIAEEQAPPIADSALGRRIALVIGNSAYASTAPLKNPKNDAELMAKTLTSVGFAVTKVIDADQATMKRAMLDFGRKLNAGADVGLFYYSGHGVQVDGRNYLVPVGAAIRAGDEVPIESVDVGDFLKTMEDAKSTVNIVVLDACRDNPFEAAFRSATRGLTMVTAPRGTYIAYSTAPGSVAEDGEGGNSTYTRALADAIMKPGLPLEGTFKEVRKLVDEATGGRQVTWDSSSIKGDFYFRPN